MVVTFSDNDNIMEFNKDEPPSYIGGGQITLASIGRFDATASYFGAIIVGIIFLLIGIYSMFVGSRKKLLAVSSTILDGGTHSRVVLSNGNVISMSGTVEVPADGLNIYQSSTGQYYLSQSHDIGGGIFFMLFGILIPLAAYSNEQMAMRSPMYAEFEGISALNNVFYNN